MLAPIPGHLYAEGPGSRLCLRDRWDAALQRFVAVPKPKWKLRAVTASWVQEALTPPAQYPLKSWPVLDLRSPGCGLVLVEGCVGRGPPLESGHGIEVHDGSGRNASGLSSSDVSAAAQPSSSVGSLWVGGYTTPLVGAILGARAAEEGKTESRVAVNAMTREASVTTVKGTEEANSAV